MAGRRPKKGERRIDAAIDHFTPMGYAATDIRAVVKQLLKVYGGSYGWRFLEEDGYHAVQEALFERQEQEEQRQQQQQEEDDEDDEEEQPQQLEAAVDEAPLGNNLPILEVNNEIPAEDEPIVDEVDPMLVGPPAIEAIMPPPAATRRPCYGWISESESESDDEEDPAIQQHEVHVLSLEGSLLCKRQRLSKWDVKSPNCA